MYEVNTPSYGNQPRLGRICHTNDTLTVEEIGALIFKIKLHIYITKVCEKVIKAQTINKMITWSCRIHGELQQHIQSY